MHEKFKYVVIRDELLKRIALGIYRDRMLSQEEAVREFNVSSRTIAQAYKLLNEAGYLLPHAHGSRINPKRIPLPPSGRILKLVPYCGLPEDQIISSKFDETLGSQVDIIQCPPLNAAIDPAKWEGLAPDGCIFSECSFNFELFGWLKKHGVPTLAINRMPDEYQISWLDWDHRASFFRGINYLLGRKFNKIIFFHYTNQSGSNSFTRSLLYRDFEEELHLFNLYNPNCELLLSESVHDENSFMGYYAKLKRNMVIMHINWGNQRQILIDAASRYNLVLNKDYRLFSLNFDSRCRQIFAEELFKTYRQIRLNVFAPPISKLITPKINMKLS